ALLAKALGGFVTGGVGLGHLCFLADAGGLVSLARAPAVAVHRALGHGFLSEAITLLGGRLDATSLPAFAGARGRLRRVLGVALHGNGLRHDPQLGRRFASLADVGDEALGKPAEFVVIHYFLLYCRMFCFASRRSPRVSFKVRL